ncbi:hypothetical protein EV182_002285 [Spiromyces aspiralis]|uniref:Uncharacterized protein n=1 Tax=Spiromyces aspiralis TaxID=68401 RepID=A0ACC1HUJ1_9FUNG|nr:hypothetical protein EV182_002285 [Spiromyces aspiralis]
MFARKEPVFPVLTDALTSLLPATAQSLVFNFAYRHIHRAISSTADAQEAYHLGSKAQTPTDGSVGKAKAISTMGVEIPTFSLSPSGYIRSIGEQILVLPQTLERMDIVAISLAEQLMPPSTSLRGTGNVGTEGGGLDAKVSVQALSDKLLILEQSQLPYYSGIPGHAGQAKEAASDCRQTISRDEAEGYDYAATHLLLFATLFSTQYDFIRHTLLPEAPIYQDYESAVNVDQILTDMDYLASIMRSLDVDLVDDFRRWHRAVGAGEKSRLLGLAGEIGDDIVQTVAKLRRW